MTPAPFWQCCKRVKFNLKNKKNIAKTVKVRAYKKLGPTGKIEDVSAHLRRISAGEKSSSGKPYITERQVHNLTKKGVRIQQYTGFSIKMNDQWFEAAHKFSF